MDAATVASFLGRLRNDVRERGREGMSEPEAFVAEVAERLEEHHHLEGPVLTFFEKSKTPAGATRIFGFAISDEGADTAEIGHDSGVEVVLLTGLWTNQDSPDTVTKSQVTDVAKRAFRAWQLAGHGYHKDLDSHGDAFSLFQRLHEAHASAKSVRVVVLSDALFPVALDEAMVEGIRVSYDVWDIARLSRLDAGMDQEPIVVNFEEEFGGALPCLAMPVAAKEYSTWLAIMSGAQVHALYRKYRLRLLVRNVRSFLQARGKVNRGIRQTLKDEPGRFLAYNNGLSAIADEVETHRLSDGREAIRRVIGLQIVNGGQTTASIFHGAEEHQPSLFGLYVQLKLTKIMPQHVDEMAPRIAEYANTQNPIRQTDLTSSAPFHIELEKLSRETWTPDARSKWFYERARGTYENERAQSKHSKKSQKQFDEEWPKAQRFTKSEVAAWMNLWPELGAKKEDSGPRPDEVSMGGEKNHAKWFRQFTADADIKPGLAFFKQLVARGIIVRATEKIAKEAVEAHRNNVVAYTVALLCDRERNAVDLDAIWEKQVVPTPVQNWLAEAAPDVDRVIRSSAGAKNVGEWCKKKECWAAVRENGDAPRLTSNRGKRASSGT
jgi:hypothetical protein